MFSWMNYVGSDNGEGVTGFYGIMEDGMDINTISNDKPLYYQRHDFYDGSGLPNSDLFLCMKYNVIYILFLFFILL